MTFTIEVEKKGKDEEFGFEDLEMSHKECNGGRVKQSVFHVEIYHCWGDGYYPARELTCTRCGRTVWIREQSDASAEIITTTIDGQERKIEGCQGEVKSHIKMAKSVEGSLIDIVVVRRS